MKSLQERPTTVLLRRVPASGNLSALYENDKKLQEELIKFAKEGFDKNETVIMLIPARQIAILEGALKNEGYNIFRLKLNDQYQPLDAETLLDKFVVDGKPDEGLFQYLVVNLAMKALKHNRNIRVFSELAATLSMKGLPESASQLESIWHKLVATNTEFPGITLTSEMVSLEVPSQSKPQVS